MIAGYIGFVQDIEFFLSTSRYSTLVFFLFFFFLIEKCDVIQRCLRYYFNPWRFQGSDETILEREGLQI